MNSMIRQSRRDALRTVGVAATVGLAGCGLFGLGSSGKSAVWEYQAGDRIFSEPTVVDGSVYIGSLDTNVYSIDAADGSEQWHFQTGGKVYSKPAVGNGSLYVGSDDDFVYGLSTSDGSRYWQYLTGGDVVTSPALANDTVYVSGFKALHAIAETDGTRRWQFEPPYGLRESSPTLVDNNCYILGGASVFAVDASTGKELWRFVPPHDDTSTAPSVAGKAIADGTLFVGTDRNNLYAVDIETREQQWRSTLAGRVFNIIVADGEVYALTGRPDNRIYALDAADGSKTLEVDAKDDKGTDGLAVEGDTLYVGNLDGMKALDATDGSRQWLYETEMSASSPVVENGRVYFGSGEGKVYAVPTE